MHARIQNGEPDERHCRFEFIASTMPSPNFLILSPLIVLLPRATHAQNNAVLAWHQLDHVTIAVILPQETLAKP